MVENNVGEYSDNNVVFICVFILIYNLCIAFLPDNF